MATTTDDYYATLGVSRKATQKEIKAAFRKLARQCHPDVKPNDAVAEKKFKAISEAYDVLSDTKKRKKYDEFGHAWQQAEAGAPFYSGGSNADPGVHYQNLSPEEMEAMFGNGGRFSNIFDMFGSNTNRSRASRRPSPSVEAETNITLEEAYHGTTRVVELRERFGTRRVEVAIPAGIKDGSKVRARQKSGGETGDLLVKVRINPHPRFRRDGDDLYTTVEVPLNIALLGGTVRVSTLRSTSVELKVPAETQNGSSLRLRGLGMPLLRKEGNGDLYALVDVRLPLPLSPELQQWAEQQDAKS